MSTRAPSDWRRKAVHAGTGVFALALRWLDWKSAVLLALAGLAFGLLVLPRFGKGIYRNRALRWDLGIVAYPASVLLLILIFRRDLAIAAAVWGMLAFGDPSAALAGRTVGRASLPWNREKTWSGLLANFVVGGAAGLFLFQWVSASPPGGWIAAVLVGAAVFALLESVPAGIEDNLVAPVPAALAVYGVLASGAGTWLETWKGQPFLAALTFAAALNALVAFVTWRLGAVSGSGAIAGALLGTIILGLGGWSAYAVLWTFFLIGTVATRLGYRAKARRGVAQQRSGRRGAAHAIANCAVAASILIVTAGYRPFYPDVVMAAFAGAFAAALSDTLATEIGSLYGRRAFSPLGFTAVPAGTAGAVSWPGLVAAVAGAALVAAIAGTTRLVPPPLPWAVAVAGIAGSFGESLASDFARRKGLRLDHEFTNGLNTFIGAVVAIGLSQWMQRSPLYLPIDAT